MSGSASERPADGPAAPERPPFHRTLTFRLAWFHAMLVAIVLVGFYLALSHRQQSDALALIDDGLRRDGALVAAGDLKRAAKQEGLLMQVRNADGEVVLKSDALGELPDPAGDGGERTSETVSVPWRDHALRVASFRCTYEGSPAVLLLAAPLDRVERTAGAFQTVLLITFPLILAITMISVRSMAKKALLPIGEITRAAKRITADNLSERLAVTEAGDELDELSETINGMIMRLEGSFEQVRRFTADASHELRTPLTAIRGETETALRASRTPEEYQDVMVSTLEEVERLSSIVSDLLVLSRAANRNDLNVEGIRLDDLLEEVVSHLKVLAEAREIDLRMDGLPEVQIVGDRARLRQLFGNLVDNAIKYTPSGGTVEVSLALEGGDAVAAIRDSGIGIAQEDLPRIFERFYRVDRSRVRSEGGATAGTGLGLSLCHWIATAHGGTIAAQSRPGEGTTFRVTLPAGE